METILNTIAQFSPIATIALALFIIWQLIKNKDIMNEIGDNHLSGLPEMKDSLMRMEGKLDKINDTLVEIKTLLRNQ